MTHYLHAEIRTRLRLDLILSTNRLIRAFLATARAVRDAALRHFGPPRLQLLALWHNAYKTMRRQRWISKKQKARSWEHDEGR
jgi:hypothetical protein